MKLKLVSCPYWHPNMFVLMRPATYPTRTCEFIHLCVPWIFLTDQRVSVHCITKNLTAHTLSSLHLTPMLSLFISLHCCFPIRLLEDFSVTCRLAYLSSRSYHGLPTQFHILSHRSSYAYTGAFARARHFPAQDIWSRTICGGRGRVLIGTHCVGRFDVHKCHLVLDSATFTISELKLLFLLSLTWKPPPPTFWYAWEPHIYGVLIIYAQGR